MTTARIAERLQRAGCLRARAEARLLRAGFPCQQALNSAVSRREAGEPLEHILGWADFAGVRVRLGPGVFVPRPRAEGLVRAVPEGSLLLDLGCGSGALAAALKATRPGATVLASDLCPLALEWARRNGAEHGFEVYRSDWLLDLPSALRGRLDAVVAYLPHVPLACLERLDRDQVGRHTVAGGEDGLDPLRSILGQLAAWLAPSGRFVTLLADEQLACARRLAAEHGARLRLTCQRASDAVVELDLQNS